MISQKNKIIVGVVSTVIITIVFLWYTSPSFKKIVTPHTPTVVNDTVIIPDTKNITTYQGRLPVSSGQSVSFVPKTKSDEVVVTNAVHTLKSGFDLAVLDARNWSGDAKLVYAKSLGTVTLEGNSSSWQYVFGSKLKKRGYEIIIHGNAVTAQKEVPSTSFGYNPPNNWYDSGDAIKSVQGLPQFRDATMSGISFYFNEDGKRWGYAIVSSKGTLAIPVR